MKNECTCTSLALNLLFQVGLFLLNAMEECSGVAAGIFTAMFFVLWMVTGNGSLTVWASTSAGISLIIVAILRPIQNTTTTACWLDLFTIVDIIFTGICATLGSVFILYALSGYSLITFLSKLLFTPYITLLVVPFLLGVLYCLTLYRVEYAKCKSKTLRG